MSAGKRDYSKVIQFNFPNTLGCLLAFIQCPLAASCQHLVQLLSTNYEYTVQSGVCRTSSVTNVPSKFFSLCAEENGV